MQAYVTNICKLYIYKWHAIGYVHSDLLALVRIFVVELPAVHE